MSRTRLNVFAHNADLEIVTHLGVILGSAEIGEPQNWWSAFSTRRQTPAGVIYNCMSMLVSMDFVARAVGGAQVNRPAWDVGTLDPETGEYGAPYQINLAGARRAQDKLAVWQPLPADPETGEAPDNPVPQVGPDKIVAVLGLCLSDAEAAVGLERIPVEL